MSKTGWIVVLLLAVILSAGCATSDPPSLAAPQVLPTLQGSYYRVGSGETLWRIAHSYGLEPIVLASVNRLPSSGQLQVGQRLFIPLPPETVQFLWPVRGTARPASTIGAVEIVGQSGSLVRASRSGRIAVATHHLSGWGKTIVMDHLDGYLSLYSGLEQLLVTPGVTVRQGTPVGSLGTRALHFEIRYGVVPRNTLSLLPTE